MAYNTLRMEGLKLAAQRVRSVAGPYADHALHFHRCTNGRFLPCADQPCRRQHVSYDEPGPSGN